MLKYRLISGILMGLVVICSIFIDGEAGRALFVIIGGFLAYFTVNEYLSMLAKTGMNSFPGITSALSATLLVLAVLEFPFFISIALIVLAVVVGWFCLIIAEDKKNFLSRMVISFSALPLIVLPLYFLALIYTGDMGGKISGRKILFFMLLVTKLGDVGAYTVGTISATIMPGGNHKIAPVISPKKSWEGTLGGMLFSIIASVVFCNYIPEMVPVCFTQTTFAILAGVLLFSGGFLGDLAESALKRSVGVKDSGTVIPGMGGAFDVIDSLVLNAPLFYLFLMYINRS